MLRVTNRGFDKTFPFAVSPLTLKGGLNTFHNYYMIVENQFVYPKPLKGAN
jgi:hypothetical protein